MTYEEVKDCSDKYLLPIKVVYKLYSQFNCMKNVIARTQDSSLEDGLPVKTFIRQDIELKEKHVDSAIAIMNALGYRVDNSSTIIDWNAYLKVQSLIKYNSIPNEQAMDFWISFFAPDGQEYVQVKEVFDSVELLTRCIFTQKSTLVSKRSGKNFVDMLKSKGCVAKKLINRKELKVVDMKLLRKALKDGRIDVQELNIHLRSDQELLMDMDEDYDEDTDSDGLLQDMVPMLKIWILNKYIFKN